MQQGKQQSLESEQPNKRLKMSSLEEKNGNQGGISVSSNDGSGVESPKQRIALVYGALGALGLEVVSYFRERGWRVLAASRLPSEGPVAGECLEATQVNPDLIRVPRCDNWQDVASEVKEHVKHSLSVEIGVGNNGQNQHQELVEIAGSDLAAAAAAAAASEHPVPGGKQLQLDAIICAAGGWKGGSVAAKFSLRNAQQMCNACLSPPLVCAHLASKFLKPHGFFAVIGATAALQPTPGMIGYGMAKVAVHHLVKSLMLPTGIDKSDSEALEAHAKKTKLPAGVNVAGVLITTLDTPSNRQWMKKADTSQWTSLEDVCSKLLTWSSSSDDAVNGLIEFRTVDGQTSLIPVE